MNIKTSSRFNQISPIQIEKKETTKHKYKLKSKRKHTYDDKHMTYMADKHKAQTHTIYT